MAFESTLYVISEAAPIITYTKGILSSNFQNQKKLSTKYYLTFETRYCRNKNIQFFYKECISVWVENHLHVSSRESRNMLLNTTGCPECSKNLHEMVFLTFQIQICNQSFCPFQAVSFKHNHFKCGLYEWNAKTTVSAGG